MHFVGENDIEVSPTTAVGADLWFNDKQVTPSDIACLDVDSFDQLFDLVLAHREADRAAATQASPV